MNNNALMYCTARFKHFIGWASQVEPSSEMRKLLQAASKLQKKKGDSYLGAIASPLHRAGDFCKLSLPAVIQTGTHHLCCKRTCTKI